MVMALIRCLSYRPSNRFSAMAKTMASSTFLFERATVSQHVTVVTKWMTSGARPESLTRVAIHDELKFAVGGREILCCSSVFSTSIETTKYT